MTKLRIEYPSKAVVKNALLPALRALTRLEDLCLVRYDACRDGNDSLSLVLVLASVHADIMQSLCISFMQLDASSCASIGLLKNLRSLKIEEKHKMSEEATDALAIALLGMTSMQELTLLTVWSIAFAQALAQRTSIQVLKIMAAGVGPAEGAAALAQVIEQLRGLRDLDISDNDLGPGGAAVLAPALGRLRGLRKLDISLNRMGSAGTVVVLAHVEAAGQPTEVCAWGNDVEEGAIAALGLQGIKLCAMHLE